MSQNPLQMHAFFYDLVHILCYWWNDTRDATFKSVPNYQTNEPTATNTFRKKTIENYWMTIDKKYSSCRREEKKIRKKENEKWHLEWPTKQLLNIWNVTKAMEPFLFVLSFSLAFVWLFYSDRKNQQSCQ